MMKRFAIRGVWMALGYLLAVYVATTVVCFIQGAPTLLPDNGAMGSFFNYVKELPAMLLFGSMMTAMYGFPGWLVSVIIGEVRAKRSKLWFAVAGTLTAALAIVLANGMRFGIGVDWMGFSILIGGFCGGLAYWAIAGKTSGNWKIHP